MQSVLLIKDEQVKKDSLQQQHLAMQLRNFTVCQKLKRVVELGNFFSVTDH